MEEFIDPAVSEGPATDNYLPIWTPRVVLLAAMISVIYFVDILIRSSHKLYWADELFTMYLCQLPTLHDTWRAVLHGADFNPPLFYVLTRTSQAIFGHGLIATRLPATVGVWVCCVCLFVFVSRRVGVIAGFIAGAFPFFTLAQSYAFEARPHGLTLGWCGLALLCWQNSYVGRKRLFWSGALGVILVAAELSHVFAVYLLVPFGLVELYSLVKTRSANWANVGAICCAPLLVIPTYVPMLKAYRALFGPIGGLTLRASLNALQAFTLDMFGPAIGVLCLILLFGVLQKFASATGREAARSVLDRELVLAVGFTLLPVFGVIGVKLTHGVFFDRYFLSSAVGWAILIGFFASGIRLRSWMPGALAASMLILMAADMSLLVYGVSRHDKLVVIEPASQLVLDTDSGHPMLRHASLIDPPVGEDILLLNQYDYLFLVHYASPGVAARIHCVDMIRPIDLIANAYRNLDKSTHLNLKVSTLEPFLETHDRFLVYGSSNVAFQPPCGDCIAKMQQAGFVLKSETKDDDGILYAYERSNLQTSSQ